MITIPIWVFVIIVILASITALFLLLTTITIIYALCCESQAEKLEAKRYLEEYNEKHKK